MRAKRSTRYKLIRGGLLAGTFLSFIPALAVVRSQANADDEDASTQAVTLSAAAPATTQPQYTAPSYTSPAQSSTTQTRPQTTTVRPRARTRAS